MLGEVLSCPLTIGLFHLPPATGYSLRNVICPLLINIDVIPKGVSEPRLYHRASTGAPQGAPLLRVLGWE